MLDWYSYWCKAGIYIKCWTGTHFDRWEPSVLVLVSKNWTGMECDFENQNISQNWNTISYSLNQVTILIFGFRDVRCKHTSKRVVHILQSRDASYHATRETLDQHSSHRANLSLVYICNTIRMMSNQPRSRHTQKLVRYMLMIIMSAIGLSSGQLGIPPGNISYHLSWGWGVALPRDWKKTLGWIILEDVCK
jgi:hypothetical protein